MRKLCYWVTVRRALLLQISWKDMTQQLSQAEKDINTVITDWKTCLATLEIQYATEKKRLENMFDDLIAKVSNLKAKRGAELSKVYNEIRETVDTTLTIFQNKQKIVENEKQIVDISLNKALEVQMMIEVHKLKDQINKHKELIQQTSAEVMEYTLSMKNEKDFSDILNKLENGNRFRKLGIELAFDGSCNAIKFSVSKEIVLCGFLSYGCTDGKSVCQVTASVIDGTRDIITVTTILDSKLADDNLLQINFPKPIKLAANTDYHAVVLMKSPNCKSGAAGMSTIDYNGVTFTFKSSEMDKNCTSVDGGQIPGFSFKL